MSNPSLKVFSDYDVRSIMRKPSRLVQTLASLAPLKNDEMPDLYGHKPRKKKHQLTQEQQDTVVSLLVLGYTWTQIIRTLYSPDPTRLVSIDNVSARDYVAVLRYLRYLGTQRVMTTRARRGEIGLLRDLGIEQVRTVRTYYGRNSLLVGKRRKRNAS